jgi:hypothetical protein
MASRNQKSLLKVKIPKLRHTNDTMALRNTQGNGTPQESVPFPAGTSSCFLNKVVEVSFMFHIKETLCPVSQHIQFNPNFNSVKLVKSIRAFSPLLTNVCGGKILLLLFFLEVRDQNPCHHVNNI